MTLLARFVGWACLVAAVVIAALTPALAAAKATSPDEQAAASSSVEFNEKDGTLNIEWSGPILPGMADYLRAALDTYAAASHRVVLFLDSAGGQVEEGDRVIHVLDEIKQTHRLITAVLDDKLCASMCIPIFLRGDDRLAARTSLWLFHEAAKQGADGKERMEETLCLFHKYYVPAGVSPDWIRRIVPIVKRADLWESGDDLVSAKTGIVTSPLEKWTERVVAPSADWAKLQGADRGRSHAPESGAPDHARQNPSRDRAGEPHADPV